MFRLQPCYLKSPRNHRLSSCCETIQWKTVGKRLLCILFAIALSFPGQSKGDSLPFYGLCYSPFRAGQSPELGIYPSRTEILEDLEHLRPLTNRLRLYGLSGSGHIAAEEALRLGYQVLVGIWLSRDRKANAMEVQAALDLSKQDPKGLEGFIVGSEVLLRGDLDPDEVIRLIRQVRSESGVPVAYAETIQWWTDRPMLMKRIANEVDTILVHFFPYWMGVPIEHATVVFEEKRKTLHALYPDKVLAIGETGWPAGGSSVGSAVPSPGNQARWLQFILSRPDSERIFFSRPFPNPGKHSPRAIMRRPGVCFWKMVEFVRRWFRF